VLNEAAVAYMEAADKRVTEEAVAKRAAEEATAKKAAEQRTAEEAVVKKATEERVTEEVAVKAVTVETARAVGGSPAPGQAPSVAGARRAAAPSGSTPTDQTSLQGCLETLICLAFSPPPLLCGFILLLPFLPRYSHSGAAATTGTAVADAAVGAAPGLAPVSEPQTPEGVPEDVVESEGVLEVA
jgi:hypothetical protein